MNHETGQADYIQTDVEGLVLPAKGSVNQRVVNTVTDEFEYTDISFVYDAMTGMYNASVGFSANNPDMEDFKAQLSPVSVLIMQGRTEDAVLLAQVETYDYPESYKAFNQLASAYSHSGDKEGAIASSQRAIDLALEENVQNGLPAALTPDQAYLYQGHALDLAQQGHYDDAIACLDKRLEIEPDFSPSYFLKGHFLEESGRPLEAMQAYEKALTMDGHEWADSFQKMSAKHLGYDNVEDALAYVRTEQERLGADNSKEISVAPPSPGAGVAG